MTNDTQLYNMSHKHDAYAIAFFVVQFVCLLFAHFVSKKLNLILNNKPYRMNIDCLCECVCVWFSFDFLGDCILFVELKIKVYVGVRHTLT